VLQEVHELHVETEVCRSAAMLAACWVKRPVMQCCWTETCRRFGRDRQAARKQAMEQPRIMLSWWKGQFRCAFEIGAHFVLYSRFRGIAPW